MTGTGPWNISGGSGAAQSSAANIESSTDEDTYIPPDLLKHGVGVAKVWIQFDGSGTISITDSYNVSSITDEGVGQYLVTFDEDLGAAPCVVVSSANNNTRNGSIAVGSARVFVLDASDSFADTSVVNLLAFSDGLA